MAQIMPVKIFIIKLLRVETQQERKLAECASDDDQRRSKRHLPASKECCLFCSQKSGGKLHQCITMELDHDLRKWQRIYKILH